MIGHFNADDLASYRAGTVSDGKAARISAHLSTCSQCADVDSGLATVSQLLATTYAPPMPETLTLRLQATIADQSAQRAARTATSALGAAGGGAESGLSPVLIPGRPDLPERAKRPLRRPKTRVFSSPLMLRGLAAAGVLVLLVGGGILLANQRGAGLSSGAAPAARPFKSRPGTAAVGSVASTRLRYRHAGGFVYANAVTSAVNYTKAGLPAGIRREVHSSALVSTPQVNRPPSTSQAQPQHQLGHTTVGQLESCLSTVAADRVVQLVELARYLGRPATIIVFTPVNGAFDVIVVGEACGPASQDIITTLLVPTK